MFKALLLLVYIIGIIYLCSKYRSPLFDDLSVALINAVIGIITLFTVLVFLLSWPLFYTVIFVYLLIKQQLKKKN